MHNFLHLLYFFTIYTFLHFKCRFNNYIFLVKYIVNNIKDYTYNKRLIYFLHIYNNL